jgi:hypothetical protein
VRRGILLEEASDVCTVDERAREGDRESERVREEARVLCTEAERNASAERPFTGEEVAEVVAA